MADEPLDIISLEGNLADAEKPPEVPAGKYVAEVQDVQAAASQAGNRYWQIKFVIPPSELKEDIADHYEDGAVLYWNRQLIPKDNKDRRTIFNLKQFYAALGLDGNVTEIDPNAWMGQKAILHVKMGQYQGEPRAEIQSLSPVEKAAPRAPASTGAGRGRRK